MNRSIFCIPNGYTVFQERTTVDLDAAVNILKSRKRRKYISACRDDRSFTAELRKDLWKCPHCNYETAATLMEADSCDNAYRYSYVTKRLIEMWGTHQLSLFSPENEKLTLNPLPEMTKEHYCPKCHRKSMPANAQRHVRISWGKKRLVIEAEVLGIGEFLSFPWISKDRLTINFPVYEVVTFQFKTGRTYIELQSNTASIAKRDITKYPFSWKGGVVYQLICDNLQIGRTIKRVFLERFKRELPFEKNERTPEKYILMTRFIGFDRRFYDSIPYLKGTFDIERTFQSVARKLHSMNGAYKLFKQSDLPDFKSVRRVFFSNAGLLFYLDECEKLWQAIADPNLFCDLMNHDCIFHILSILHQRPCLFEFVFDYSRLQGTKGLIKRITHEWSFSIDSAVDYCTMNKALRLAEQQSWRRYKYSGADEVHEPIKTTPLFSLPMRQPLESIQDCILDGFTFSWLRTGNDYYKAGKLLKNCLCDWKTINNPVVLVKRRKKPVAAIEVSEDGVRQFLGYDNSDAYEVPGLCLTYHKWLVRFHLKDIRYSIYNE